MWIVLSYPSDSAALWAFAGLERRGLSPIRLINPATLPLSLSLSHTLGSEKPRALIRLTDGSYLDTAESRGVLNRMTHLTAAHLSKASAADREYATQEMTALFMSVLRSFSGPVLNPPSARGLSGDYRMTPEWFDLAARAGLPSVPCRFGANGNSGPVWPQPRQTCTVLALRDRCFGPPLAPAIEQGVVRLAALAGCPLLSVDFAIAPSGEFLFAGADTTPDLRLGGEAFLDHLAAIFRT